MTGITENSIIFYIASYLEFDTEEFNITCNLLDDKYQSTIRNSIKNGQKIEYTVTEPSYCINNIYLSIGCKLTLLNDNLHSFDDQPAVISPSGNKYWYKHGKLHRDNDLPAVIRSNGNQYWYKHGKLHRDNDLPAAEVHNGDKRWYKHDKLHRYNDLPAVKLTNGNKYWYSHGKPHRDNGRPASIWPNGNRKWYRNGVEITPDSKCKNLSCQKER